MAQYGPADPSLRPMSLLPRLLARTPWRAAWLGFALAAGAAQAQFATVPAPTPVAAVPPSEASDATAYRRDAARHLYANYPRRIHKGKLPPLIYAVMITDTEIDAAGHVVDVRVVRPPAAAKEVAPWVVQLIRRASPFPAPARLAGQGATVVYREIWLVDRTALFQVDSLTEGQL